MTPSLSRTRPTVSFPYVNHRILRAHGIARDEHVIPMEAMIGRIASGDLRRGVVNTTDPVCDLVASVSHLAWRFGENPALKAALVTSSKHASEGHRTLLVEAIMSRWFRELYPAVHLDLTSSAPDELRTTSGCLYLRELNHAETYKGDIDVLVLVNPETEEDVATSGSRSACFWHLQQAVKSADPSLMVPNLMVSPRYHKHDLSGMFYRQPWPPKT